LSKSFLVISRCFLWFYTATKITACEKKRGTPFLFADCTLIYRNVVLLFTETLHSYLPKTLYCYLPITTLDRDILSEIYDIRDTLTIRFRGDNEPRKVYSPYSFDLNLHGKYYDFLKELSLRNEFFKSYYESTQVTGGIGPTLYAKILHENSEIDFSQREERLVVIISFLSLGKPIYQDK
jgi:hypothetical protein